MWPHPWAVASVLIAFSVARVRSFSVNLCKSNSSIQSWTALSAVFFEEEEVESCSTSRWEGISHDAAPSPEELPSLIMNALKFNDMPTKNAGLRSAWRLAGDTTRHVFRNNETEFIEMSLETAATHPTSFYGAAMNGKSWIMETALNRVGGETGWIATQVMKTVCSDGRVRRWQWELRKRRRPPNIGSWYVESIGSSDRNGRFNADG